MLVIKRDGDKQDFSFSKIHRVVESVFCSIKQEVPDGLFDKLDCYLRKNIDLEGEEDVDVDDIHNTIEQFLMVNNLFDASRAYIQCRYNKALKRSENERLMKGISEKLSAANVQNSNANLDESSFGGRLGEATRYVVKDYALNFCMSKKSKMNHLNNEIYIHDLDSYAVGMHNCLTIPFDDLLAKGFNTRSVDIRPANSANTAFQLIAVIFQLQSLQQFGGVSASHIDHTMVPYVRKSFYKHYKTGLEFLLDYSEDQIKSFGISDEMSIEDEKYKTEDKVYNYALKLTTKEVEQAAEGLYHNLNSLQSRSGNQLPFYM
jgi:ribonucleoside-triphosphate reductase